MSCSKECSDRSGGFCASAEERMEQRFKLGVLPADGAPVWACIVLVHREDGVLVPTYPCIFKVIADQKVKEELTKPSLQSKDTVPA